MGTARRRWSILVFVTVVLGFLSGCSYTGRDHVLNSELAQSELSYVHDKGSAKVRGEAFFERPNGKVLRARGRDVALVPRSARSDAWIKKTFGSKKITYMHDMQHDLEAFFKGHGRVEIATSGGRFTFHDVGDGDYYLVTLLLSPSDIKYRFLTIMERVRIEGGDDVRVVMRGY